MRYSRRTLNYLEEIIILDLTNIISITDLVVVSVVTSMIYNVCSSVKEFIELVCINP